MQKICRIIFRILHILHISAYSSALAHSDAPAATGAAAGGKHAEGVKQEEIGKRIGWSRGKVSQHASLEKIDKQAWKKIATNFSSQCSRGNNDDVAENATNVANIFSEGLLRDIIQLTPAETSRRARA